MAKTLAPLPPQQPPALLPRYVAFRAALDPAAQVDAATGTIKSVAVLTANLQPRGWAMWCDERTLDTMLAVASAAGPLKSYLTHGEAPYEDRQGEEIGLFSAYRRDGTVLRADFAALDAFRKHDADDFDRLFELAVKAPAQFGVSPIFEYTLAWVRLDGSEVPTALASWRWDAEAEDYRPVWEPAAPADARTPLPSCRVTAMLSVDFTDMPATNPGLFSAHAPAPAVDASRKSNLPPAVSTATPATMHKQLFAKFRSAPAQLARAIELHESDEKASFDSIIATVEREGTAAEIATLRTDLGKREGEIATLRSDLQARDARIAELEKKTAADAAVIAAFRKGGASGSAALPLGASGAEAGAESDPIATLRSEIAAITGIDPESARKRGELTAKLRTLQKKAAK